VENLKPKVPKDSTCNDRKGCKSLKERLASTLKEAETEAMTQLDDGSDDVRSSSANGTGLAVFSSKKRRNAAIRRVKRMLGVLTSGDGPQTEEQKRAVKFLQGELKFYQTGQGNIRIRAAKLVVN